MADIKINQDKFYNLLTWIKKQKEYSFVSMFNGNKPINDTLLSLCYKHYSIMGSSFKLNIDFEDEDKLIFVLIREIHFKSSSRQTVPDEIVNIGSVQEQYTCKVFLKKKSFFTSFFTR